MLYKAVTCQFSVSTDNKLYIWTTEYLTQRNMCRRVNFDLSILTEYVFLQSNFDFSEMPFVIYQWIVSECSGMAPVDRNGSTTILTNLASDWLTADKPVNQKTRYKIHLSSNVFLINPWTWIWLQEYQLLCWLFLANSAQPLLLLPSTFTHVSCSLLLSETSDSGCVHYVVVLDLHWHPSSFHWWGTIGLFTQGHDSHIGAEWRIMASVNYALIGCWLLTPSTKPLSEPMPG